MAETPQTTYERRFDATEFTPDTALDFQKADRRLLSREAAQALLAAREAIETQEQVPDVNEQCRAYFIVAGNNIQTFRQERLQDVA